MVFWKNRQRKTEYGLSHGKCKSAESAKQILKVPKCQECQKCQSKFLIKRDEIPDNGHRKRD